MRLLIAGAALRSSTDRYVVLHLRRYRNAGLHTALHSINRWSLASVTLCVCVCLSVSVQFYLRPASHYSICLSLLLFQPPRNRYAKRQILSYAMPTADESNHSAAGTLCMHTAVSRADIALSHPQIKEICPFPNWRYKPPKFPLEQARNENCLYSCLCTDSTFKFHICPASRIV